MLPRPQLEAQPRLEDQFVVGRAWLHASKRVIEGLPFWRPIVAPGSTSQIGIPRPGDVEGQKGSSGAGPSTETEPGRLSLGTAAQPVPNSMTEATILLPGPFHSLLMERRKTMLIPVLTRLDPSAHYFPSAQGLDRIVAFSRPHTRKRSRSRQTRSSTT